MQKGAMWQIGQMKSESGEEEEEDEEEEEEEEEAM